MPATVNRSTSSGFASVATASTDAVLVSAPAAPLRIRVLGVALTQGTAAGAVTFNSKGAGAGTAVSAAFLPAISTTFVLPAGDTPWFVCKPGEGLTVTTGTTTTAVPVHVAYDLGL